MELTKYEFKLKDYKKFDSEGRKVYLFENKNCDDLLDAFYKKIDNLIGRKEHFPIIRIADGEFQFLLGKNEFNLRKPLHLLVKNLAGELYRKLFRIKFEARSRTYTSGVYSHSDRHNVKNQYSECLKYISEKGILALYTIILIF